MRSEVMYNGMASVVRKRKGKKKEKEFRGKKVP